MSILITVLATIGGLSVFAVVCVCVAVVERALEDRRLDALAARPRKVSTVLPRDL